ncbi:LapB repeat-containing protein [Listeria swaminathanii]|uniref:LapB repeat-containing protein n=1 Tax=Listeria swaminathanii TaxID=2713501 RepID=A0ABU2IEC7_9LIST|nr:LapB repeat-containing protein [Listeria swaminathanii]MDT0015668.1 LapB repeat-containing protein [Listeria swaminathanii]MDT0021105.1 LapB repeat-containing protein [Listeria swaminathanii]MDT0032068.1 LapB repeat-containing protein [Listeria swaminathanii]MDT0052082.1 LapB repeat-containing protein [Listeria swaminathanii]MDT0054847.1 LapB repeat-containing protein [Listeria swaminathanii]
MKKKFSIVIISVLLLGYLAPFDTLLVGADETTVTEDTAVKTSEAESATEKIESETGSDGETSEEPKETEASKETTEKAKTEEPASNIKTEINTDKNQLKQANLKATVPAGSTYNSLFPDDNLAKKIAVIITGNVAATGNESVDSADLLAISQLDLSGETGNDPTDISNIEGLQYLENLTSLNLSENNLTDLAPLKDLVNMVSLNLSSNPTLVNISGVEGLVNLQELNVSANKALEDISQVASLPMLKEISAQGCNIQTLELDNPAGDVLPELETFYLQENDLTDLTALAKLPKLKNLYIKGNASLKSLETLNGAAQLQLIDASNCTDLETLGDISGLLELEMIQLSGCSKLKEITSLKDLPNLVNVTADGCAIEDLGTLDHLPKLQTLVLSDNKNLTNINAVTDLPQLKTVALDGCGITSIGTLDNLPKLEKLDLKENQLTSISEITDLPRLSYLDVSINNLTTIGELKKLPLLEWLNVSSNRLSNVSALTNFPSLNYINVSNNVITTIGKMTELPSLKEFYAQNNNISDLSMIHDMANLRKVDASSNLIANLGTFDNLPKLQSLDVHSNRITTTAVIHDLPSLETFNAKTNLITNIGTMDNLPELTYVDLSFNRIPSLAPIGDLPELQTLNVSDNNSYLRSMGTLDGLPKLRVLDLHNNYLNYTGTEGNLSALSDLTNLTELNLRNNVYIDDISGLSTLSKLFYLNLDSNKIEDISALTNLTNLQELTLESNKIEDISPLSDLKNLNKLVVSKNKIIDISPVADIVNQGATVTASSQTLTLPTVLTYQGSFTIDNPVIWYDGTILAPSSIGNSGNYKDGKITWTKMTAASSSTLFNFNRLKDGLTFSGTITQPYKSAAKVTADAEQTYTIGDTISEEQFLKDVDAKSADGAPVTSDFATVVDLNTFGEYEVTLTSEKDGVQGDSCKVIVKVLHGAPVISADPTISYDKHATISEKQFLEDIHASTDLDTAITTNFSTAVNLNKGGDYTVALNSENEDGVKAETVYVTVTVYKDPAPIISAKTEITYDKFSKKTEAAFLDDIDAATNDGSVVTSNFATAVNLDKAGDYTVTLNSINSDSVAGTPTAITVHVDKEETATISTNTTQQYEKYAAIDEEQFLEDVHANINASPTTAVLNSDFETVVKLDVPGTYTVTITATNEDGGVSAPKEVSVTVRKLPAPEITADGEITYPKFDEVSEAEFLSDIHAAISEKDVAITSNFSTVVKLNKAGDYTVMLNATNEDGVKATPVEVIVHVQQGERPVITADATISYDKFANITEAEFLEDIHATSSDGQSSTVITSNFETATNFKTAMTYTVTLNAVNEDGIGAEPVAVTVTINKEPAAALKADAEVSYAKNEAVTESDFFKDIHLEGTEAPSTAKATSNFDSAVDRSKTGDYTVTINATNEDAAVSTPIEVIVHIGAENAPVITAKSEVKYNKHEQADERRFLYDSEAKIDEANVEIKTDFAEKVDVDTVGTYTVTLTATNEDGQSANPVEVSVIVSDAAAEKVNVKYVDENGLEISAAETLTGNLDEAFSIDAKSIAGYKCDATLSGVFSTVEQTVVFHYKAIEPGVVTIKYKDANGKAVAEDKQITGDIGDDFEAEAQTVSGYSCQAIASGKITEEPQTITFTYSTATPSKKSGEITVQYVDESGKKLADSKKVTGNMDDSYSVEAKAIDGYSVVGNDSAKGVFTEKSQTVTFKYKKNTTASTDSTKNNKTNLANSDIKQPTNTKAKTSDGTLPETGDTDNVIWIVLVGVSMLIISIILLFRKPKTNQ